MPDFTLSDALSEAYASDTSEPIISTLEIRHVAFTQPIRVVNDHRDFVAYLEADAPVDAGREVVFIASAFELTLPEVIRGNSPEIEIQLDNVSGEVVQYLDAAANSGELIEVTYRPYLPSDRSRPAVTAPITLQIKTVSADMFRVKATAGYPNLANSKFPSETYTSERFPGLVQ